MREKMKAISVRLPPQMIAVLKQLGKFNGGVSEVVRKALVMYLSQLGFQFDRLDCKSSSFVPTIPPQLHSLIAYLLKHNVCVQKVGRNRYTVNVNGTRYVLVKQSKNMWQVWLSDEYICTTPGLTRAIIRVIRHRLGLPSGVLNSQL